MQQQWFWKSKEYKTLCNMGLLLDTFVNPFAKFFHFSSIVPWLAVCLSTAKLAHISNFFGRHSVIEGKYFTKNTGNVDNTFCLVFFYIYVVFFFWEVEKKREYVCIVTFPKPGVYWIEILYHGLPIGRSPYEVDMLDYDHEHWDHWVNSPTAGEGV